MDDTHHHTSSTEHHPDGPPADTDDVLLTVADAVDHMTTFLTSLSEVDATLDRMCRDLVATVADADAAGVTVIRRGRPLTTSFTDDVVLTVDKAQYRTHEGPCLEAAATRTMVRLDGASAAQRFPKFWERNLGSGMRSFLSAPVAIDDDHYGALNLYSRGDHGFSRLDEAALRIYVTVTGSVLAAARRATEAQLQVEGFKAAMDSRAAIEQCKGVVMAVMDVSDEKAFELIRWRSQETNIPVRRLCEQILRDIAATPFGDDAARAALGTILMTAHTRVEPSPST